MPQFLIRYAIEIVCLGDGQGPMSVPSAQKLRLGTLDFSDMTTRIPATTGQPTGYVQVPGGATPTLDNFDTALVGATADPAGGMALDLHNAISTNLTRIQGFATGGG